MANDPNGQHQAARTETSAPPNPKSPSGLLDGLNARLATIGAIVTAIVGLNSALTSCSTATVNRYAAFRSAVGNEETFWKERFAEYVGIVAVENKEQRTRKLFALAALAQHPVPDFEEYSFSMFDTGTARVQAIKRLNGMRDTLNAALASDRTGDPEVAKAVQQSAAFEQVQAETAQATNADVAAPVASTATVTKALDYSPTFAPQTMSAGKSAGWDIDLFWCAGGTPETDKANYAMALDRARRLGILATRGASLAPGVVLGRIRLRALPELQQGGRYPALGSGNTLSADSDPGEQEAAAAVIKTLNNWPPEFVKIPSDAGSQFYMSAYICGSAPKT